jgi:hypothetical protein
MSAALTPGDWYAAEWSMRAVTTVMVNDPTAGILGKRVVAECETEDDARLIAASKELLDAAQAAWNCIAELSPTQARVEVAMLLQAAIAKATGRAA